MEKTQKRIVWAVIVSEGIHAFCCVLPAIFTALSLLAGLGIIATVPAVLTQAHDVLHAYELPMIFASAIILAMGWGCIHTA